MNHLKTIILALFSIVLLFASCSIEKRVYRSGYHIDWNASKTKSSDAEKENNRYSVNGQLSLNKIESVPTENDAKNKIRIRKEQQSQLFNSSLFSSSLKDSTNKNNECDVIIFRSGEEIEAKVMEVTETSIKYKKCDNLNGPLFTENKSKIFMIKYPNGTNTVIKKKKSVGEEINEALGFDDDDEDEEENAEKDEREEQTEENPGDRSLLIAIVLWAFLGVLGIHRFYTGHYVLGVLYLLTGAFCGIGWLIDGILFLSGSYSPKRGKFTDDF